MRIGICLQLNFLSKSHGLWCHNFENLSWNHALIHSLYRFSVAELLIFSLVFFIAQLLFTFVSCVSKAGNLRILMWLLISLRSTVTLSDFHCQHLCINSFAPNLVYGSQPPRRLDMKDTFCVSATTNKNSNFICSYLSILTIIWAHPLILSLFCSLFCCLLVTFTLLILDWDIVGCSVCTICSTEECWCLGLWAFMSADFKACLVWMNEHIVSKLAPPSHVLLCT